MLFSAASRKGQPDPDLHSVENPEHSLVSNKPEEPAKSWLTYCPEKPWECSCQQQARRANQILTYTLFKIQSTLVSATSRKVSQTLTYILFKTQTIVLSATSRKGQLDPDLQPVENQDHGLVSNKQEGSARSWLTSCLHPRACSYQQHKGDASQILTYKLFKTQTMLLSATSRKEILTYTLFITQTMQLSDTSREDQRDADIQTVQNPEHALVSNKQRKARCLQAYKLFIKL